MKTRRGRHILWLYLLLLLVGCDNSIDESLWQGQILLFFRKYPDAQLEDVYKVLFQATFGPGHLGNDSSMVAAGIMHELDRILPDSSVKLTEPISPDSSFVWINLKKFKHLGLNPGCLADVILLSSKGVNADTLLFMKRWRLVGKLIKDQKLKFDINRYREFTKYVRDNAFPVIHHSTRFIREYDPHYRVVKLEAWRKVVKGCTSR